MNADSDALAAALAARGVAQGDRVALFLQNVPQFVIALLAACKYPRRVEVLADLPKTPTGKLLRRELRQRALGG